MHPKTIEHKIYEIDGIKVMLDFDLAELYETETKRLKEAVRRNIERFPPDFMYEISPDIIPTLRTQFASSKRSSTKGGNRYNCFAFTEQGVAMLSSVLNNPKAIEINIQIMRTFVAVRQMALSHQELSEKIMELETKYDQQFNSIFDALNYLIKKEQQLTTQQERRKIGYKKD